MKQNIQRIFDLQKAHCLTLRITSPSQRISKLQKLKDIIQNNESLIFEALEKDLGKSKFEAALSEVYLVYAEINYALKHLNKWMSHRKVASTMSSLMSKNRIYYEPKVGSPGTELEFAL